MTDALFLVVFAFWLGRDATVGAPWYWFLINLMGIVAAWWLLSLKMPRK